MKTTKAKSEGVPTEDHRPEASAVAEKYQPTDNERRAMGAHFERRKKEKPAPRLKTSKDGLLGLDHPDEALGISLLLETLGTADTEFANGLLSQLANAAIKGTTPDENQANFMLSMVKGIEPRDQVEAMLAAQMAAVHNATMTFARRLNNVETIPQQDSAERAFNKLARTFAAQMEALKRYRTGGQQKVTVEHVTVNQGGQAIVGNVTHKGGGGDEKTGDQSHAKQIANAPGTAMPCDIEAEREAMPSASRSRS